MPEQARTFWQDFKDPSLSTAGASLFFGGCGGMIAGFAIDSAIQHPHVAAQAQNTIDTLQQQQTAIQSLEQTPAASHNQSVQEFLQNQYAADTAQINALQPVANSANEVEAISAGMGGIIIGVFATAACITWAKRSWRNSHKATLETAAM